MIDKKQVHRRAFLKNTALGVVGAGVAAGTGIPLGAQKTAAAQGPAQVRDYRMLGKTGFKASDIALGGVSNVDVIKAMLDAGVNYIDTAESYDKGKSEIAMGQAIKGRDRKSLFINTKLHIKEGESEESILKRAYKCLERLDTPYIDSLMTHNPPSVAMAKYEPFHKACARLIKEGKLRFVGISSHGSRGSEQQDSMEDILLAAVKDGRYSVMLLVYNFINRDGAEKILAACQKNKIGCTLMKTNPVGRYLAMKSRMEAMEKQDAKERDPERTKRMKAYFETLKKSAEEGEWFIKKYKLDNPAEIRIAATRFGLSHPAVTTVLARVSNFEDMEQFLQASGTTLSGMEKKKLAAYKEGPGKLYCRHACGLCEPACPHGVPVNTVMRYNHYFEAQRLEKHAMEKYAALPTAKADRCENCTGTCEAQCPYGVPVRGLLTLAHQNLSFEQG